MATKIISRVYVWKEVVAIVVVGLALASFMAWEHSQMRAEHDRLIRVCFIRG